MNPYEPPRSQSEFNISAKPAWTPLNKQLLFAAIVALTFQVLAGWFGF